MSFIRIFLTGSLFVLCCFLPVVSVSASVVSFSEINFQNIQYDDRIRMSSERTNDLFEKNVPFDVDGDGYISYLEESGFSVKGDEAQIYVGNIHNRFDIYRVLLAVGVRGEFKSIELNGDKIESTTFQSATDSSIFYHDDNLKGLFDHILLYEIEEKLEDRQPNDSSMSSNPVLEVLLSDIETDSEGLQFYVYGYGSISNGTYNSFTPPNATVLFLPDIPKKVADGEEATSFPVPEPSTFLLTMMPMFYMAKKRRV